MNKGLKAACPECEQKIVLNPGVNKGDWINCPHCQAADIEVIGLEPPLLDWAYEEPIVGSPFWKRFRDREWIS